jgi:hypothetical protein
MVFEAEDFPPPAPHSPDEGGPKPPGGGRLKIVK